MENINYVDDSAYLKRSHYNRFDCVLCEADIRKLIVSYQSGDLNAGNLLVRYYYKLIKKAVDSLNIYSIDREDLVQYGVEAFIETLNSCDPLANNEFKFSIYLWKCIKGRVIRAVKKHENVVRYPTNIDVYIMQVNRVLKETGLFLDDDESVQKISDVTGFTEDKVKELNEYMLRRFVSLEITQFEDESCFFDRDDVVRDMDIVDDNVFSENIRDVIKLYTSELEFDLLCKNFGMGCNEHSFVDLGKIHGVTRARIYQILVECKRRLANNPAIKELYYAERIRK